MAGFITGLFDTVGDGLRKKNAEYHAQQVQEKTRQADTQWTAMQTAVTKLAKLKEKQEKGEELTPQEIQEAQQAAGVYQQSQTEYAKLTKANKPVNEAFQKIGGFVNKVLTSKKNQLDGPKGQAQPQQQPAQAQPEPQAGTQPSPNGKLRGPATAQAQPVQAQPSQPLTGPAKPQQASIPPLDAKQSAMLYGSPQYQAQQVEQGKRETETFKTDEGIRKEQATAADRLALERATAEDRKALDKQHQEDLRVIQGDRDKAKKEIEELKEKHTKELSEAKGADAKTIESLKAEHAKQLESQKAEHAKELAAAKAAAAPAKKASAQGSSVPAQVAKGYTAGGKSIANPTGNTTIDTGAWDYIATGKIPFTGMSGGKGVNTRELMIGRAGELLADMGLTAADLPAIRGKIKGDTGALAKVTSMGAMVRQFEGTLTRNMETAKKLSEAWQRSDFPFVNKVAAAFKTGTGDAEALNLAAQLHGVAREWGKIMAGSTSAAGIPVSEANASDILFSKGISNGQLKSMMDNVILPDVKNRTSAIEEEKNNLVKSLRGDLAGPTPSPNGTLTAPPKPESKIKIISVK